MERRKLHKRIRIGNSVQAYACICACGCACVCNVLQGGVSNDSINKLVASAHTDADTKAYNR